MKVLFVYPNINKVRSPQLGICMLAAVARGAGHDCDIYDLTTIPEGQELPAFEAKLHEYKPDLLAISCRSAEWFFVKQLLKSVDVGAVTKVIGGPHATVAPEQVIEIADIVVRGEGEKTFQELLERTAKGEDVTGVDGCWVRQGRSVFRNKMRGLISDLDQLPIPYWKIFDDIHYYDSYTKKIFPGSKIVGTFEGSRGCPFACTYCTNNYVRSLYTDKGKWRREKSPERIIQEMRLFQEEYGLDCVYTGLGVYWIDEVFLTRIDRLKKFKDLYSTQIGKPFGFMERPENMRNEKVKIIRQAGARSISIGIESGDEDLRRGLLNRLHSQECIVEAFRIARAHGLITHAFTILGLPGGDLHSIKETYKLIGKAKPDSLQVSIFYPLKGTALYNKCVREGIFDPDTDMPANYYKESCLKFQKSWKEKLMRYQFLLTALKGKYGFLGWALFRICGHSQILFTVFSQVVAFTNIFKREGPLSAFRAGYLKLLKSPLPKKK